jgi:hypothetical protein
MTSATRARGRRAEGPRLPTLAELRHATAHTQAVLDSPHPALADVYRAAEFEAATLHAFWQTPGTQAKYELEAGCSLGDAPWAQRAS